MSTETITLQLPIRLYADLTALAAEEHTDVVGIIHPPAPTGRQKHR
jgi:hypothetical protein